MKKIVVISVLILMFLFAGCTKNGDDNNGVQSSTDALKIVGFHIDPIDGVYEGENVYFEVEIQNIGDTVVENVYPRIVGLPDSFSLQDSPDLIAELEPSEFAELLLWNYVPLAMYTTTTYPFEVAIDYDYKTHSEAIIRVASRDWIRSLPEAEKEIEIEKLGEIEPSKQSGPIHTSFKMSSRKPYAENGEATVYLEITNLGSGRPNNDEVFITVVSGDLVCDDAGYVKLVNGEKGNLKCTAFIGDIEEWKNIEASLEISYKYTIRKTDLTVTVFGKSEEQGL